MTERAQPARKLTALEWRLYIIAVLATIYVISWRVLDRPAATIAETGEPAPSPAEPVSVAAEPIPTPAPPVPAPAQPAATAPPRAVWLDDLPAGQRPVVVAPPGWTITTRDGASQRTASQRIVSQQPASQLSAPPPRPIRVLRAPRLRTRSS